MLAVPESCESQTRAKRTPPTCTTISMPFLSSESDRTWMSVFLTPMRSASRASFAFASARVMSPVYLLVTWSASF